jgi:hypothetical protein
MSRDIFEVRFAALCDLLIDSKDFCGDSSNLVPTFYVRLRWIWDPSFNASVR